MDGTASSAEWRHRHFHGRFRRFVGSALAAGAACLDSSVLGQDVWTFVTSLISQLWTRPPWSASETEDRGEVVGGRGGGEMTDEGFSLCVCVEGGSESLRFGGGGG